MKTQATKAKLTALGWPSTLSVREAYGTEVHGFDNDGTQVVVVNISTGRITHITRDGQVQNPKTLPRYIK